MKGIKASLYLLLLYCLTNQYTLAQYNFTLYNMHSIAQSTYANPAIIPDRKINIGLPVISSTYLSLSNSGFKYTDLVKRRADDSLYLDVDNLLNKLAKNNYLTTAIQIDLLSFGFKIKKNYFSFNATEKAIVSLRYPKDFIDFVWNGNGASLGETKNFNFGLNLTHYREYGIGMAREISDKLTVGAKLKYLYGMENVYTKKSDFMLYTDPSTFAITAQSNIEINTSGFDSSSTKNFSFGDYAFKRKNKGMGIDLGGVYSLDEKTSVSASLIDLGFINWKSGVTNHVSKYPDASFTYEGVNTNKVDSSFQKKALDSLSNRFSIVETHESYRTSLSTQFYLGGNYSIIPGINAGALIHGIFFDKQLHLAYSISGNVRVARWLSTSLSYSIVNRSYNNIGFGLAITSPVQFYVVTDNILGVFLPQNTKNLNVRIGINITIGKNKDANGEEAPAVIKPPAPKY